MNLIFHIDVNSAFLSWTACGLLEEGGADDSASCADLTQKNTSDPASDAAVNAPATTLPPTDIREIASGFENGCFCGWRGRQVPPRNRAGEEHTCQTIWDRHR